MNSTTMLTSDAAVFQPDIEYLTFATMNSTTILTSDAAVIQPAIEHLTFATMNSTTILTSHDAAVLLPAIEHIVAAALEEMKNNNLAFVKTVHVFTYNTQHPRTLTIATMNNTTISTSDAALPHLVAAALEEMNNNNNLAKIKSIQTVDTSILVLVTAYFLLLVWVIKESMDLKRSLASMESSMKWLVLATLEHRLDYWHPRQSNIQAHHGSVSNDTYEAEDQSWSPDGQVPDLNEIPVDIPKVIHCTIEHASFADDQKSRHDSRLSPTPAKK